MMAVFIKNKKKNLYVNIISTGNDLFLENILSSANFNQITFYYCKRFKN